MRDKVWVLNCNQEGCRWNHMVPREAQWYHRQDILDQHKAEAHRILPRRLSLAIETPGVKTILLRQTSREALHEFERDVRLIILAGYVDVAQPRRAQPRIEIANGSRVLYIGGSEHHIENQMRGLAAALVDGAGNAPEASERALLAGARS